jgi:hypothetical protein
MHPATAPPESDTQSEQNAVAQRSIDQTADLPTRYEFT